MERLRIALAGSRGIPHTYSGYETFFGELAPRLVEHGHEVIVYCRSELFQEKPPTYRGVRLIYLPSIESKNLSTITHTLISLLDASFRRVDVVFVANVANAALCVLPRISGSKVALNVDGVEWKRSKWSRIGQKYFYWNAQLAGKICPSGIVTDAVEMQRIYREELDTPSVCIAYGANIERSSNPDVIRKYGLEPRGYYLIASRLVPENNADLILKGFEQSSSDRLLAIAGGANYRSAFVDALKKTRDPRVRFLGHVGDNEHVKELHCNCYGYIHGHSVGGTNPALLKALGYGNLIFALDTPFNQEVLEDYGLLFRDPADLAAKLQRAEENPEQAEKYRARAPRRIEEKYTWEHVTDQYEDLFLRLAAGESPAQDGQAGLYVPRKKLAVDNLVNINS
jgi:glycosyltransferase involved in cell wall biosynthesis